MKYNELAWLDLYKERERKYSKSPKSQETKTDWERLCEQLNQNEPAQPSTRSETQFDSITFITE